MKKIAVFLADGFEEVEGLTVVDLLRRAKVDVTMVSIKKDKAITGAHGIVVMADACFDEMSYEEQDLLVLPGGMPGTIHLGEHKGLTDLLVEFNNAGKNVSAICAAPSVLGKLGILNGKNATSYPGFEDELKGADVTVNAVEVAGNVVTSRGMGTAIPFALALIELLIDKETADGIKHAIIYG